MFCDLKEAFEELGRPSEIDSWYVNFAGFDGNTESTEMAYCQYLINAPGNSRLRYLERGDNFNSHMAVLDGYRRMLAVWRPIHERALGKRFTRADIVAIISERPHQDSEIGEAMRTKGPRH